jgi:hypothetical protein
MVESSCPAKAKMALRGMVTLPVWQERNVFSASFFVCCAFPGTTWIPCCSRMSYSAIRYTPVACIATMSTWHDFSHSAI